MRLTLALAPHWRVRGVTPTRLPDLSPLPPRRCAILLRSRACPDFHARAFATVLLTHVAITERANCSRSKQHDSPALEILDMTIAMNLGWAKTRDECARLIIYRSLHDSAKEPIYHPPLVGDSFFDRINLFS